MSCSIDKYKLLVALELEDLKQDVSESEDLLKKRFKEMDITNYVFLENMATLQSEMLGVDYIQRTLEQLSKECESVPAFKASIESHFETAVEIAGFPGVISTMIQRKLNKIEKYIELV